MKHRAATCIIAASEADSNLYYACKFLVPDPIVYFEVDGKKHLVLSDLEIDRAKHEATVHRILSLSDIGRAISKKPNPKHAKFPLYARVVDFCLSQKKVKEIIVPTTFPAVYYEALKKMGYQMTIRPDPFYLERLVKTQEEKKHIQHSLKCIAVALEGAVRFLQAAKIKGNRIYSGKEVVTSEMMHSIINTKLMELGCVAHSTIVASGAQGSLPHHHGHGPLIPHTPIIFDIFPRDQKTLYWGDQTRTMVKGKPSATVKKMFETVYLANRESMALVKEGVSGATVHKRAQEVMEKAGFKTGPNKGRMEGFIHSTGHGLGLDIHELPSVSVKGVPLKTGNVVTIEPGLYYQQHGGMRIEDVVFVKKTGFEQLTIFPTFLEIDH